VRELDKQARECIDANFNVIDPNTPLRASQKLIAVATLLRALPAPSTPATRNLHHRHRLSSSRQPCNRPKARHPAYASRAVRGTTAAPKAKRRPSVSAIKPYEGFGDVDHTIKELMSL
jgi:hypothetical protein